MNSLLSPQLKTRGKWMIVVVFLMSIVELLGLASLVPLISVIVSENQKSDSSLLSRLYAAFGTESKSEFIVILCVGVLLFFVVKSLIYFGLYKLQSNYVYSIYRHFSSSLLQAYYNKGLSFIKKNNSLMMIHNVNSMCLFFSQSIVSSLLSIFNETIIIVLMVSAAIVYEPAIVLLLMFTVLPVCYFFYRSVKAKMNDHGSVFQHLLGHQNKISSEILKGYVDLEIKNKFQYFFKQHKLNAHQISKVQASLQMLMQMPSKFIEFGIVLSLVAIILVGQFYFSDLSRLSAIFAVFGLIAFRLLPSLNRMITNFLSLKQYQYVFSIFRDSDLTFFKEEEERTSKRMKFSQNIKIDSVSFRYNKNYEAPVLKNFNCTIEKGQIVGIVGRSGSGKSTLLNILLNFIQPDSGTIKVDGVEVTADNVDQWRNIIGYVPQDVFISEASLGANIAFAEDAIDAAALQRAIKLSNLTDFVSSLPDGVDTLLAEGGNNLSGGQRQRIGIARALYKNAEILFFDEATSALDQHTEEEISESIRQLSLDKDTLTIVIIAHRLTTLKNCTRIFEIREGSIYKESTYEELVA